MSPSSDSAFHSYLNAIRRRWHIGLIAAATVVAVAAPIAMGLPNLYRSGATLKVDQPPDPLSPTTATTNPMVEVNARLETIRQEVLSRQRALDLAEEMNIYPELRQAGQLDSVVATMQRDVKVDQLNVSRPDGRMTTVSFRVTYTGNDPVKVAAVANRLATYYVERGGAIRSRQASRTTDSLRSELATTASRLEAQDKRVMDYTRENAGSLPSQMSTVATRISQLTTSLQANTAEITRLTDQYENGQRQIAALLTPSGAVDPSDPTIALARAQRELENLLGRFTEASIEVRSKRSEIATLEKLVASRVTAPGTTAPSSPLTTLRAQMGDWQTRLEALRKTNTDLQAELARNEALLANAPIRSAEFDRLTAEAQQTRTLYNSISTRLQEALAGERAQTGTGAQDFVILDPAVAAESPSAPDRQLLLGAAAVAALVLGIALVLLLDYFDRSFRSVDELRAFTHVPVLATIPRVVSRKTRTRRIIGGVLAGAAVSVVLGFVSVGVFHLARQAEPITRLLIR
jgi:polysaccharide chain length determinant protein (PEP-CTERM system associated)